MKVVLQSDDGHEVRPYALTITGLQDAVQQTKDLLAELEGKLENKLAAQERMAGKLGHKVC